MGLVNMLRKVGVLRSETTGWRGDWRDRPETMHLDATTPERKTFFCQESVRMLLKGKKEAQ